MNRSGLAAAALGAALLTSPSASPGQVPVFPSEVELVTIDVVALDEKGAPLRGLGRDDFALSEDGKPQAIVSFEAVAGMGVERDPDGTASPVVTNVGSDDERAFVLLIDDLGLDAERLPRLLPALLRVLETSFREGDRLTLVTASGSLWWGVPVPEGQEDLTALLAKVKGSKVDESLHESMSDYEAYQIANVEPRAMAADDTLAPFLARVVRRWMGTSACATSPEYCARQVQNKAAARDQQRRARTRGLMAAVERAVFSLGDVRGRKELLLLSDGFLRDAGRDEVRQVSGLCREANVVVSFLDARGTLLGPVEESPAFGGRPSPQDLGDVSFERRQDEIGGSLSLVEDTGGLAVTGGDDVAAGVRRILEESRVYYLLGYHPPGGKGPRDWRKIKVTLRRPGARVRARQGYSLRRAEATPGVLSASEGKKKGRKGSEPSDKVPRSLDVDRALLNASVSRALPLRVLPYVGEEVGAGKVRVLLAVEVDERAFSSHPTEGDRRTALRVVVQAAHLESGETLRGDKEYAVSLPASRPPAWTTLHYPLELARGVAQVRLVVREQSSGRLGAVTLRIDVPEGGELRLATPILADELREPREEGSPPRLSAPAHRVFSSAKGTLYCQMQVLGATPSPAGAPAIEASYVLRRVGGEEVARSLPSLIKVAPGGPVGRLVALSLGSLPNGDYELALRAKDHTSGRSVERVEAFRLEGERDRKGAVALPSTPDVAAPAGDLRPRPAETLSGPLQEILRSAGEYVVSYESAASGVVLEESYNQSLRSGPGSGTSRALVSDFVLVALPGEVGVMGFRDVFQVDGRKVRDRDQRLEKLFLSPGAREAAQARVVLDESARYNLGATRRNFNLPTIALTVLRPEVQPRFAFRDEGRKKRRGRVVREIAFEEVAKPTLIRDPEKDRDYVARGSFLVVPETGEVLRSEMRFDHEGGRIEIAVEYAFEATLELWLPATMIEQDDRRVRGPRLPGAPGDWGGETLTARAEYRKPRRFGVTTEEKVRQR